LETRRAQPHAGHPALLLVALAAALLATPGARAEDDALAAKLRAARAAASEAVQPPQAAHPDAERRKALESTPATPPTPRSAGPRGVVPPPADWEREVLEQHDWEADLAAGGPVVAGLQLALGAPPRRYGVGEAYALYLALANRAGAPRVLDALPADGSLARADGIRFRVRSDTGEQVVALLQPKEPGEGHPRQPLEVGAGGRLQALVDLSHLAATSPALWQLLEESTRVSVRAEIASLGLASNELTVELEPR
jgi:hypothetical protein